jgi:hypothetical protein
LTDAVDCEVTGGGAVVATDDQLAMNFVAGLQTSVDRTAAFQHLGDPKRVAGMAVAVGVAGPTSVAVAAVVAAAGAAGMDTHMEEPGAYHQA